MRSIELKLNVEYKKLFSGNKKTPEEQAKAYSKEQRLEMYKELEKEKIDKENERCPPPPPVKISSIYGRDGQLRQCNEGKYIYRLKEYDDPEWTYFEIDVPKFLFTDQLDANIYPEFVSIRVKDKLTQIKLWEEIIPEESKIQRSETTGIVHFSLKKKNANYLACRIDEEQLETSKEQKNTAFYTNIENIEEVTATMKEQLEKAEKIKKMIEEDEELDDLPDLE